jgi:hypothetical protein
MSISSFISNSAETREVHQISGLRSRYYKSNYIRAKECILEYVKTIKAEVNNVDDVHKEIFIQGSRFHIIVSFVQVNPRETSIDIKVDQYGLMGMHRPRKRIIEMYKYTDSKLAFKGISLHP